jgi:hypothetical protein
LWRSLCLAHLSCDRAVVKRTFQHWVCSEELGGCGKWCMRARFCRNPRKLATSNRPCGREVRGQFSQQICVYWKWLLPWSVVPFFTCTSLTPSLWFCFGFWMLTIKFLKYDYTWTGSVL